MTLPTKKTPPVPGLGTRNILIYGDPKTGKTTLASELRPETTLFLATEDGLSAIDAFSLPVRSWEDFLHAAAELMAGEHHFDTIVIDTVDELARMCTEYAIGQLAKNEGLVPGAYHASDFEYGKGWAAITEEFRMKVSKLCSLGMAVVFISHTKTATVKDRTGLETTRYSPDVGNKGMRNWLLGFVDLILYAYRENTDTGANHLVRFQGDANVESGGRVHQDQWAALPDVAPMDAGAVMDIFNSVWTTNKKAVTA